MGEALSAALRALSAMSRNSLSVLKRCLVHDPDVATARPARLIFSRIATGVPRAASLPSAGHQRRKICART